MDISTNAPYAAAGMLFSGASSYFDREAKYLKFVIILYAIAIAPFILWKLAGPEVGFLSALVYMVLPVGLIMMPMGAWFCGGFAIIAIGSIVYKSYRE